MALGECRQCGGVLAEWQQACQDSQGRLLGRDGKPVRMDPDGRPLGVVAYRWNVCCGDCGLPAGPDHPYQRQLDAAYNARQAQAATPAATPPPARPAGNPPAAALAGLRAEADALRGEQP